MLAAVTLVSVCGEIESKWRGKVSKPGQRMTEGVGLGNTQDGRTVKPVEDLAGRKKTYISFANSQDGLGTGVFVWRKVRK